MDLVEEKIGDILVEIIHFKRATIKEADEFKELMIDRLDGGFTKIIIDLTHCEFIDSTFLGVLVSLLKKVSKEGGDLKLIGFQPAVHAMFELTRMYRVFDTFSDIKEAAQSFK